VRITWTDDDDSVARPPTLIGRVLGCGTQQSALEGDGDLIFLDLKLDPPPATKVDE
jgi:hypothetical protein